MPKSPCRHGLEEWSDCEVCGPAINRLIRLLAEQAVSEFLAKGSDRWMSADECATYLALQPTRAGKPNRRGFLERVACKPDFPKPLAIGNQKSWKFSEIEEWAEEQRRAARG